MGCIEYDFGNCTQLAYNVEGFLMLLVECCVGITL